MTKDSRRRRHHVVPCFHLRGFASDSGMLRQFDLPTGVQRYVSITDTPVMRDFYTVRLDDGSPSDEWERRLSQIEAHVAPLVRAASKQASGRQPTPSAAA